MNKPVYYKWGANSDDIFISKLRESGYDLTVIDTMCADYTRDMNLASEFITKINGIHADGVISFDYFPILSMVCDVCKIPYYSWVYDSPHFTLYAKCAGMKCNRIAVFDRALADRFRSLGVGTVFHLPLAADATLFADSVRRCTKDFSCDVSFVGSLYNDDHEYYGRFKSEETGGEYTHEADSERDGSDNLPKGDPGEVWRRLDELTEAQAFEYSEDLISAAIVSAPSITDHLYGLMEKSGLTLGEDYIQDHQALVYDSILTKHVTVIERRDLLESVAEKCRAEGYGFRLFTASEIQPSSPLGYAARHGGYVDYLTQMPKVFYQSRINLNISLRTIRTGIPLRVIDILACGGFLLTNPQAELYEYMKEGEDFEAFRSVEECLDKIEFYLTHEDVRKRIAENGLKKAVECFSYEKAIPQLLAALPMR